MLGTRTARPPRRKEYNSEYFRLIHLPTATEGCRRRKFGSVLRIVLLRQKRGISPTVREGFGPKRN